jgi:hypothetical protein
VSQEGWSIFWEVIVSVSLGKKFYMYMYPIPNGFRDRAISLYSSSDKKEILRTVSNNGIYCSSDKFGTVYLVQYIFENSTVNINALCNSREDMACCSSVQCTVYCTVGIATGYGLGGPGSTAGRAKIFLISTAPRPTLGLSDPPIHWVPRGDFHIGKAARA